MQRFQRPADFGRIRCSRPPRQRTFLKQRFFQRPPPDPVHQQILSSVFLKAFHDPRKAGTLQLPEDTKLLLRPLFFPPFLHGPELPQFPVPHQPGPAAASFPQFLQNPVSLYRHKLLLSARRTQTGLCGQMICFPDMFFLICLNVCVVFVRLEIKGSDRFSFVRMACMALYGYKRQFLST